MGGQFWKYGCIHFCIFILSSSQISYLKDQFSVFNIAMHTHQPSSYNSAYSPWIHQERYFFSDHSNLDTYNIMKQRHSNTASVCATTESLTSQESSHSSDIPHTQQIMDCHSIAHTNDSILNSKGYHIPKQNCYFADRILDCCLRNFNTGTSYGDLNILWNRDTTAKTYFGTNIGSLRPTVTVTVLWIYKATISVPWATNANGCAAVDCTTFHSRKYAILGRNCEWERRQSSKFKVRVRATPKRTCLSCWAYCTVYGMHIIDHRQSENVERTAQGHCHCAESKSLSEMFTQTIWTSPEGFPDEISFNILFLLEQPHQKTTGNFLQITNADCNTYDQIFFK